MSLEETLADQLTELNVALNELLKEIEENDETKEVVVALQKDVKHIIEEIESGKLDTLFGHFFLFLAKLNQLYLLTKDTQVGQKLYETISEIVQHYTALTGGENNDNTENGNDAVTPHSLEHESRLEELERSQTDIFPTRKEGNETI